MARKFYNPLLSRALGGNYIAPPMEDFSSVEEDVFAGVDPISSLERDPDIGGILRQSRLEGEARAEKRAGLPSPIEQKAWLSDLGGKSLGMLEKAGNVLDLTASLSRDLLWDLGQAIRPSDPRNPGKEIENPLDQFAGLGAMTSHKNRRQHRDTLRHLFPGLIDKEDTYRNWWLAEFPLDIVTDPLTYASFGGVGILSKGAKALGKAGKLGKLVGKGTRRVGLRTKRFLDAYKPYTPKGKHISNKTARQLADQVAAKENELLKKYKSASDSAYKKELHDFEQSLAKSFGIDSAREVADRADDIADARAIEEALGFKHDDILEEAADPDYLKSLKEFQDDIIARATSGDLSGPLGGTVGIHGGPFSSRGLVLDDYIDAVVPGSAMKVAEFNDKIGRFAANNVLSRFVKQHMHAPAMGLLKKGHQALAEQVYPARAQARAYARGLAMGKDRPASLLQNAIKATEDAVGQSLADEVAGKGFSHFAGPERARVGKEILGHKNMSQDDLDLTLALMDANARVWAQKTQRPVDEYFKNIEVRSRKGGSVQPVVGDRVNWVSQKINQWSDAKEIKRIDQGPGGQWYAFFDGSQTGVPLDQLQKEGEELYQLYRFGEADEAYKPRVREYIEETINNKEAITKSSWEKRVKKAGLSADEAEMLGIDDEFWAANPSATKSALLDRVLKSEPDLDLSYRRGGDTEFASYSIPYGTNYTETVFNVNVGKKARKKISKLEKELADVERQIIDDEAMRKFGKTAEDLSEVDRAKIADDMLFQPEEVVEEAAEAGGKYVDKYGQEIPRYVLEYDAETKLGKSLDSLSDAEVKQLIKDRDSAVSSWTSGIDDVDDYLDEFDDYTDTLDPYERFADEYAEPVVEQVAEATGPSAGLLAKRSKLLKQIKAARDMEFAGRYTDPAHFSSDPSALHSRSVSVSDPEGKSTLVNTEIQSDHQQRWRKQNELIEDLKTAAAEGKDADSVFSSEKWKDLPGNIRDMYVQKGVPAPEYQGNAVRLAIAEQIQRAIDEGHDYVGFASGNDIAISVGNPAGTSNHAGLTKLYDQKAAKQWMKLIKKLDPSIKPEEMKAGFADELGSHTLAMLDEMDSPISAGDDMGKAVDEILKRGYDGKYTRFRLTDELKESFQRQPKPLFQTAGGHVLGSFKVEDTKKIISLFEKANFNTLVHETGHMFRRTLAEMDQELLGAVEKHYGVTGKWSRSAEERFAKDFQAYVKEGKFANDSIKTTFDRLKAWLIGVYQTLVGSSGNRKISDEIRGVFDDMLGDGTDPVLRKSAKAPEPIDIVNNVLQHMMERTGKVGATKAWDEATMRLLPDRVSAKEREALERELGPIIEKMAGQMQKANRLKANTLQAIGIKLEDFEGSLVDHAVRRGAGKGDPLEGKIPLAPTQGKVTRSRADEIRDIPELILEEMRLDPEVIAKRKGNPAELADYLLENYGEWLNPAYEQGSKSHRTSRFVQWIQQHKDEVGFAGKLDKYKNILDENGRTALRQLQQQIEAGAGTLSPEKLNELAENMRIGSLENHALNVAKMLKRKGGDPIHNINRLSNWIDYQSDATRFELVGQGIHSHLAENMVPAGSMANSVDLESAYKIAGMDPEASLEHLSQTTGKTVAELGTMEVPSEVAEAASKVLSAHRPGEWQSSILSLIDEANNLFKSSVTVATAAGIPLFPSFFARNYTSGQFINATSEHFNIADIKSYWSAYRKALALRKQPDSKYIMEALAYEVIGHGKGFMDATGLDGTIPPSLLEYITRNKKSMDQVNHLADVMNEHPGEAAKALMQNVWKGDKLHKQMTKSAAYGGVLNAVVEYHNRMPMYVYLRDKGFSPQRAAEEVKKLHFDYSELAPTEKEFFKRAIPFYTFSRKASELFARQLMQRPGGGLSKAIVASNRASESDAFTPQYIADRISVPATDTILGSGVPGQRTYITGFGLPYEDTAALVENPFKSLLERVSPYAQFAIERATGRDTFRDQPLNEIRNTGLRRVIGNIAEAAGQKKTDARPYAGEELVEHVLRKSPFSRIISTARQVTDPRKTLASKALSLGTGIKIQEVDKASQLRALRDRGEERLREMRVSKEAAYTPDYLLQQLPPAQRREAEHINALLRAGRRNQLAPLNWQR